MERIDALENGNPDLKKLPTKDKLAENIKKVQQFNDANTKALIKLVRQDLKQGKIDQAVAGNEGKTLAALGHLNPQTLNESISEALQARNDDKKTKNEKKAEEVLASEGTDEEKILKILKIEPEPRTICKVLSDALNGLKADVLAKEELDMLAENNDILNSFADSIACEKIIITNEQMKKYILLGIKDENNGAKNAVLRGLVKADYFDEASANLLMDSILKTIQTEDITNIIQDSNLNYKLKLNDLSKNAELKPIISKDSTEIIVDDVNVSDIEQQNKTQLVACRDKDFLNALLKDQEFKEKIKTLQNSKFENPNDLDALKSISLTPEEMRKILKNANHETDFADDCIQICAKAVPEEVNKKSLKKIEKISDKLESADREKLAAINNSPMSESDKINTIYSNPNFTEADDSINTEVADECVDAASPDEVKQIYDEVITNMSLVTDLLAANPELAKRIQCQKNAKFCESLFDEDGTEVPVDTVVLKPQLKKLMTLEEIDGIVYKQTMHNIQMNADGNETIDGSPMETYRDMIVKAGVQIFDRALSQEQAMMKKLQDQSQQTKDLQSAADSMNIDGKSNDDLQKMLDQLRAQMMSEIEIILQSVINEETKKV